MLRMTADVILPLGIDGLLTYSVPYSLRSLLKPGDPVVVPLGVGRKSMGVVYRIGNTVPAELRLKDIEGIIPGGIPLSPTYLDFLMWVGHYYMTPPGIVLRTALPAAIRNPATKPVREKWVLPARDFSDAELNLILGKLKKTASLQYELLLNWVEAGEKRMSRKRFIRECGSSLSAFKALCDKEIFRMEECEKTGYEGRWGGRFALPELTDCQRRAFEEVCGSLKDKHRVLIHGITSSGKTEIYMRLIARYMEQGRQVLYLVPEISLTHQLVRRLKAVFGSRIVLYHSGFTDAKRAELWHIQAGDKPYPIVLGVRSSIFLPFRRPGLIIVDEEHDSSYKQTDSMPCYNARDMAVWMAFRSRVDVVLGSATPSFETYRNAISGKYGFVSLPERYGEVNLPEIHIEDMKELRRKRLMKGNFSPRLFSEIRKTLKAGNRVLLFRNRKGYSAYISCEECGYIPKCRNCDVTLTYYKKRNLLLCRYCGWTEPMKTSCPACGHGYYRQHAAGTEKIEEETTALFPGANIARLDADVAGSAELRKLLSDFERGETDILVGTRMIARGLDFEKVGLVGVLDADAALHSSDFRAEERFFQLLLQMSGRSGRRGDVPGHVLIQTAETGNRVFSFLDERKYDEFYRLLARERILFSYPPFSRLIRIELRHKDENTLRKASNFMVGILRNSLGRSVYGPALPDIARISTYYRTQILLKLELKEDVLTAAKKTVLESTLRLKTERAFTAVKLTYDVDPL